MMRQLRSIVILLVLPLIVTTDSFGAERFPPPDFESGHELPVTTVPSPRQSFYEYIDLGVLVAAIGVASYLALRRRSRRGLFVLTVFSLLYFGFWRKGCICPIGAIQNITMSIFDSSYAAPLFVLGFFLVPLVSTLFFGRTFCAAVCPLGAVQDLVLVRPVSVPGWLEKSLRLLAYVYLGAAVLFAATGSAFIICRYDPFVSIFRLSGNLSVLILAGCFLLAGMFIGRPYCRFLCPYGVILRQLSRISRFRVTITPDDCIHCRLCEDACPFGAIKKPTVEWPAKSYSKNKRLLGLLIVALPVFVLAGGWLGGSAKHIAAKVNWRVRLAERIYLEDRGQVEGTTDASDAFRATGEDVNELYSEAYAIRRKLGIGGWIVGGFLGLVAGLKLVGLSIRKNRVDYEADAGECLSCGRCFSYCPREHARLERMRQEAS